MSSFDSLTNLYSLSKTLRFELKPVGKTQKLLDDNKIFEKDEKRAESYKEAKKYFNALHREFIDEALKDITLPINLYEEFEKILLSSSNFCVFPTGFNSNRRVFERE